VPGGYLMNALTEKQFERYKRNILLDGVGSQGQVKLLQAKVLVVGSGGLGSPAAYYLAAAGVGNIGLVDGDRVDLSNLQRQILHTTSDLGRPKTDSARDKLTALNPDIHVICFNEWLGEDNYRDIITGFDLVVDGTDNFATRFLINRACVEQRKPYIFGGVLGYTGQVMTIIPGRGPCLACIFRDVPPESAPSCASIGVLGAVPGMIGTAEAAEAVKLILGLGEPLVGRLMTYDALTMRFYDIEIGRDQSCPICGSIS